MVLSTRTTWTITQVLKPLL